MGDNGIKCQGFYFLLVTVTKNVFYKYLRQKESKLLDETVKNQNSTNI